MDSFAEYMLPEGAHNRVEDWTYMILNRTRPQVEENFWIHPESALPDESSSEPPMLFTINLVRTKYDSSVRRGAIVKAMMFVSRYHFVEVTAFTSKHVHTEFTSF